MNKICTTCTFKFRSVIVTHISFDRVHFQVVGENIVGIAVDLDQHYLFWSDLSPTKRGIYRSDLDGLQPTKIIDAG